MAGKLVIFWDYDTQWGADRSRSPGGKKEWGNLEFENIERLLELHAQYDILACFAIVGAAALPGERPYHDPQQIQLIHRHGHEIASHSMYHDWLPGMDYHKLLQTLRDSKGALENCIGEQVVSFVPPYNQPFDYPSKLSVSLSERKQAGSKRINLKQLGEALGEIGYRFSRVSYQPLPERLLTRLLRKPYYHPSKLERIGGVTCLRLNTDGGFRNDTLRLVEQCVHVGGFAVVYGHPHSLHAGNSQDETFLIPFFERIKHLVSNGSLEVILPRQLIFLTGQS